MNNQLLIPDDKIYIYPSDWKQPVRIQFESGSTIDTVNYGNSHHTIQFDKWVDYDTIVTDETLQKFIKDYVSKNLPKEEYSVSKYISEEVQQQAALQLHIEIENDCKIEFDNFRFQIDEDDMTVCRYGEPDETFVVKRKVRLFLLNNGFEFEIAGPYAEQMYRRYLKLINGDINTNSEYYCESLL